MGYTSKYAQDRLHKYSKTTEEKASKRIDKLEKKGERNKGKGESKSWDTSSNYGDGHSFINKKGNKYTNVQTQGDTQYVTVEKPRKNKPTKVKQKIYKIK